MITINDIKKRLIDILDRSGIKQKELAEKLAVTQSCVAHYFNGDIVPSLDTFANLCKVLDVDANYLLCLSDYM